MKIYQANIKVEAVFYDGSKESEKEIIKFCTNSQGKTRLLRSAKMTGKEGIFLQLASLYGTAWVPVVKNSYIVKYPSNLFYPYKKSSFEKRFKEIV